METMELNSLIAFYKGKKVLITGHTGFKGSWLAIWLYKLGAKVAGFALPPDFTDGVYNKGDLSSKLEFELLADINDFEKVNTAFTAFKPDIVFHLAAQPLVGYSYKNPRETFSINMMGTVNVLECVKQCESVESAIIITTDKVYENKEWFYKYRENDTLGGYDPYSASKCCCEFITQSYSSSFFAKSNKKIATVRAGNVIGGGDWAENRIVPDCVKSLMNNQEIEIRNPIAVRPWQHVLEPLAGYLLTGKRLAEEDVNFTSWNFGPDDNSCIPVQKLVDCIIQEWGCGNYKTIGNHFHETKFLALDYSKAKYELSWQPILSVNEAVKLTIEWYKKYRNEDVFKLCLKQIKSYEEKVNNGSY